MLNKRQLNKKVLGLPMITLVGILLVASAFVLLMHFGQPIEGTKEILRIDRTIKRSEDHRKRFIEKRERILISQNKEDLTKIDPWGFTMFFWNYFPPPFTCPYSVERIGGAGDGGKWLCGFDLISDDESKKDSGPIPCIVYSFGVGPDSSFEREFYDRTNCLVYAYDYTVEGLKLQEGTYDKQRIHFEKLGLGNVSEGVFRTLGDIMRKNNHPFVDFLKVDVEGAEFVVFEQIFNEFEILPFGHLNLEVHVNLNGNGGEELKRFYNFWNRLEEKELRAFNWETNHQPCVDLKSKPFAHEYSFVNLHYLKIANGIGNMGIY